ncbi:MAG: helix-turn-helix domain-containing protein [Carboxylicivirga sp.]|jgi:AraC-like DNA-binding protein|nr:helix-turn-helix domain-containing protein [Carboxylicivirga sp.]
MRSVINIETIYQLHQLLGLEGPMHPLVSIIDFSKTEDHYSGRSEKITIDMYAVILKSQLPGEMKYGRKKYDFQEGTLMLLAPGQSMTIEAHSQYLELEGWGLFIHPDFLHRFDLGKRIGTYSFFSYDLNESLHLSDKEKGIINDMVQRIEDELKENIDASSHTLVVSYIELILNYCTRFYNRQFITRATFDSDYVSNFKRHLYDYFNQGHQLKNGLPTVAYLANKLFLSPKYLSDLIKNETGRNAIDHIHLYILDLAKNKLINDKLTVSEVAYQLGFEYPQYFSRVFKKKLGLTPADFIKKNSLN